MTIEIATIAGLLLAGAVLLHWLPLWRRQGLWFGVTVAPGFADTPVARQALGRYRTAVWMLALVAIACTIAGVRLVMPWLMAAGMLGLSVGASVAFAAVRTTIRPFAAPASGVRSAGLSVSHEGLPGGAISIILPLGILAATALYLHGSWQQLPERLPVHWGADGLPNRWADRTWTHVYGPLIICAIVGAFQLGLAEVILHASPRGRGTGTEAWTARFRRANVILLIAGIWAVSGMISVVALLPLFGTASRANWAWMLPLLVAASLLPFVWQLVRLTRDKSSGTDGTPDDCWKFGLFYYNPNDPAIMVEKRFGLGFTFNFGNTAFWWILGAAGLIFLAAKSLV